MLWTVLHKRFFEYLFNASSSISYKTVVLLCTCIHDYVLISQTNRFQLVAGFNDTNNAIFVMYQYQDEMMQWSSANSEVSIRICEAEWKYELPEGNSTLHSSIVNNTNVNEAGRYAFLFQDGVINPAGRCTLAD